MATRTFTNGGVDNLWSTVGNWDTPPVDNDTVVIAAGQTCEYDIDNSAWANGINGLTITGTLKISRVTSSYLKMKAATTINGAGTFNVGESAALAIPFAVKCTITGGANWFINGAAGLTMTVYAAEPVIKTILLTALEPIGETVIAVDTSVVADIWADGDTIRIDDINRAQESEERVIAAGGIAAGTITITAGLTAAKSIGAYLHLISRNVKFLAAGATSWVCQGFTTGKLIIAGGQFLSNSALLIYQCTGVNISGGTFSKTVNYGVFLGGSSQTISGGVFSGNAYINQAETKYTVSGGTFTGNGGIFYTASGVSVSGGIFAGNANIIIGSSACSILGGTFSSNTQVVQTSSGILIFGGTFSGNSNGINLSSAIINNVTFSGNVTADVSSSVVSLFNVILASTENVGYTGLARETYSESINHDQVAGAFKSWTKGGVTSSQAVTVPVGYTKAMQTVLENAAVEGYWQKEYTVGAGASVNITMNLRKSAAMAYLPRCIIFNKASTDPFAGGAGINTFTMTDSIDTWEASTYTYYNSTAEDVTLVVRFQGMNASGNMFSALLVEQINVDLTAVLAALAVVDGIVDDILVDTGTDIPADIAVVDGVVDAIKTHTDTLKNPKLLIDGEIIV